MTFVRDASPPNTFGMMSRVARRTVARAAGQMPAETGRHAGGPCPAVALATLTGWSYARAAGYLAPYGFHGDGMYRGTIQRAFIAVLGQPLRLVEEPKCRVADVGQFFQGGDGLVHCTGHVMPVRGGRVLNATPRQRTMPAGAVLVWRSLEAPP